MIRSKPVVEVIDDDVAEIYRRMSGEQRMALAFDIWETAHAMVRMSIKHEHPDWEDSKIDSAVLRRMSHD